MACVVVRVSGGKECRWQLNTAWNYKFHLGGGGGEWGKKL